MLSAKKSIRILATTNTLSKQLCAPNKRKERSMAAVLALVGSARRWGNSELLAREALLGAAEAGANTALIRLTDLHIEPCDGCLRCALLEKPCRLDDDMAWLLEQVRAADGLILAAPTYFLGPAAIVKLILDRLLMMTPYYLSDAPRQATRPGATIGVMGRLDWRGVTRPFLNAVVLGLGFHLAGSLLAVAPGPGEALLNDELLAQVHALGRRLGGAPLDEQNPPPLANTCPVCYSDFFVFAGDHVICPVCGTEARVSQGDAGWQLTFTASETHRWTLTGLHAHVEDWIRPTAPRFLGHREEIRRRRERYKDMTERWIEPAREKHPA